MGLHIHLIILVTTIVAINKIVGICGHFIFGSTFQTEKWLGHFTISTSKFLMPPPKDFHTSQTHANKPMKTCVLFKDQAWKRFDVPKPSAK